MIRDSMVMTHHLVLKMIQKDMILSSLFKIIHRLVNVFKKVMLYHVLHALNKKADQQVEGL